MNTREAILKAIQEPMKRYYEDMTTVLGNWQPLERAAGELLEGRDVCDDEIPHVYLPLLQMMRLIGKVTRESEWDWSDPRIQEIFKDKADSPLYRIFTNAMVGTVSAIISRVRVGTLVEVGTGPGQVTQSICEEMIKRNSTIPLIISDRAPGIAQVRKKLAETFPSLAISAYIWNVNEQPPGKLVDSLVKPVLVFERFCLPYAGHEAIDMISPIADILVMQDDLSITGRKMAFDFLYEKIGTKFLTFREAMKHLKKHFSFIHTCDKDITEAINSGVTTFTLAIK
jgi:hypothetical protein